MTFTQLTPEHRPPHSLAANAGKHSPMLLNIEETYCQRSQTKVWKQTVPDYFKITNAFRTNAHFHILVWMLVVDTGATRKEITLRQIRAAFYRVADGAFVT